ncbi:uncharacterized protein ALTATR162_LOCUS9784 [Alternaria atra]|uniref:BTB domain-containing protein n=1 Tax=Alternaria atra TaxID=119953 RepID=A0A8J2I8K2_9PLEO|nr:uncharacterized protein ALTATR162_LOCUS9784 [Alternaria atra]CAG5181638.1 unnamed protein product [Alternaria atra]
MPTDTRAASAQLVSYISALRDRGEFTDLVFYHDIESFDVHRVVVCAQSKVLHKACTRGFEEEFTGVIQMGHVPHLKLKRIVSFLYNANYNDDLPDRADISPLQLHAQMFSLADQYDISNLDTLAAEKYLSKCTLSWAPLEFLTSIPNIYTTTPSSVRRLRDIACMIIQKHLPKMLSNKDVADINPLYGHCTSCGPSQPMEALQARCKQSKRGNSGFGFYHS